MNGENQQPEMCECYASPNDSLVIYRELGMDHHFAEVRLLICAACGQIWLCYFYENEAFSHSGRWYMGPVASSQIAVITAENARETLEGMDWYMFGGSYFDGKIGKSSGDIYL
jgi:hypothetical protein